MERSDEVSFNPKPHLPGEAICFLVRIVLPLSSFCLSGLGLKLGGRPWRVTERSLRRWTMLFCTYWRQLE